MQHKRVSDGEEWFGRGAVCEIQEDIALHSNNKGVVSDEQKRREKIVSLERELNVGVHGCVAVSMDVLCPASWLDRMANIGAE